ncbi:uncharacterized protein LODBEIA_P17550 [Lodderomyces beijingensis]|uniref:Uncharacterized protein n=1 Tax=Lodderomyces beijingensis TaxID=1775926 RepID=A0ABP0ZKW4_9ASCO
MLRSIPTQPWLKSNRCLKFRSIAATALGTVRFYNNFQNKPPPPGQPPSNQLDSTRYHNQLIHNAVKSRLKLSPSLGASRKLPFRTIFILIATSSSLSMFFYLLVQLFKFHNEEKEEDGSNKKKRKKSRSIFLPLWLNPNLIRRKTFHFPQGVRYLDEEYYEYLMTEIAQMCHTNPEDITKREIDAYLKQLENTNVHYSLLEKISMNKKIREIFGLPLTIETGDSVMDIRVELKYPSVSGLQINLDSNTTGTATISRIKWAVQIFNFKSVVDDSINSISGAFETLDNAPDAVLHEAKSDQEPLEINNKHRYYEIHFQHQVTVKDQSGDKVGKLHYKGTIDFDHPSINRGIKLCNVDLVYSDTKYKIV